MGQIAGTFDSYDSANNEDLADVVYNISPTQTPFMTLAGRTKATYVYHEWTTDSLAAASSSNFVIEADDVTIDSVAAATRVGNRCGISDKAIIVSGTNEAIRSPGDNASMSYQMAKRAKELKRDMETILLNNNASVAGTSSAARQIGGFESWITSNVSRGATGASGGFSAGLTTAATDGTQRAFTEALLKTVIQSAWTNGGDPSIIMTGPFNKSVASGFTGIATQFKANTGMAQATILGAADYYVSNFGEHRIVPNRFSRDRTALLIDPEYVGVAFLRPFSQWEIAKTGDANKRQLLAEYTLEMKNQAAHGVVADLLTT
jgi:hypothetical protein